MTEAQDRHRGVGGAAGLVRDPGGAALVRDVVGHMPQMPEDIGERPFRHFVRLLGRGKAGDAHMLWQIRSLSIDDRENCLRLFRANRHTGLLVLAALALGHL